MIAHINLEDEGDKLSIMFQFPGGFDPNSKAHQACNMIRAFLDSCAQQVPGSAEESVITTGGTLHLPIREYLNGSCDHRDTVSAVEDSDHGQVLFRCTQCGLGRGADGAWKFPALNAGHVEH